MFCYRNVFIYMKISRLIIMLVFACNSLMAQRVTYTSDTVKFNYSNEEVKISFENLPIAVEDLELIIFYKIVVNPVNWRYYNSYCCSEKQGRCLQMCTQEESGSYFGSLYCRFPYDTKNYYYVPANDTQTVNSYTFNLSKDSINKLILNGKKLTVGLFSPAENYSTISNNYYYLRTGNGVNMNFKSQVSFQLKYNASIALEISNQCLKLSKNVLTYTNTIENCSQVELFYSQAGDSFDFEANLCSKGGQLELSKSGAYKLRFIDSDGQVSYSNIVNFKQEPNYSLYSKDGLIYINSDQKMEITKITKMNGQDLSFSYNQKEICLKEQLGQVLLLHCVLEDKEYHVVKIKVE